MSKIVKSCPKQGTATRNDCDRDNTPPDARAVGGDLQACPGVPRAVPCPFAVAGADLPMVAGRLDWVDRAILMNLPVVDSIYDKAEGKFEAQVVVETMKRKA